MLRADPTAVGVTLRREPSTYFDAGTRLDTELGEHRLELGYGARVREFWESSDLDTFEHHADARLDLYGVDVEAHLDGGYRRLAFPQGIQLRGLIRIDTYTATAWSEARFGRFGVRVGGSFVRTDYLQRRFDALDSRYYRADAQVYTRLLPKLRALLEYNVFAVTYDAGRRGQLNDYLAHQVRLGLDGSFTPKLSASLKAGATYQDVDVVDGRDRDQFRGFTTEASLGWRPFARTSLTLSVSRTLEPSFQSNYLVDDSIRLEVAQRLLAEKLQLRAYVQYERAQVSQVALVSAHLNRVRCGASAIYSIRTWLSVALSYDFGRLGSPFPDNDYSQHTVTLSVGAGI